MATFRGITYYERFPGSPVEQWQNDGVRVKRIFDVAWTERGAFIAQVLGYSTLVGSSTSTYVNRITPMTYGTVAGGTSVIYATSVAVEGVGPPDPAAGSVDAFPTRTCIGSDDVALYNKARLTVEFQSLTYEILEDSDPAVNTSGTPNESLLTRYVTIKYQPRAEYLTAGRGEFKWSDDSTPIPQGIPFLEGSFDVSVTWHLVPTIPTSIANGTHIGKVNDATFLNQPAATYLLTAAEVVPIRSALGLRIYDLNYKFKYYQPETNKGHNFLRKPPVGTLTEIERASGGAKLYPTADFSLLFKPY